MKLMRRLINPLAAFIGIQLVWILVVVCWIYWFMGSHRQAAGGGREIQPGAAAGGARLVHPGGGAHPAGRHPGRGVCDLRLLATAGGAASGPAKLHRPGHPRAQVAPGLAAAAYRNHPPAPPLGGKDGNLSRHHAGRHGQARNTHQQPAFGQPPGRQRPEALP